MINGDLSTSHVWILYFGSYHVGGRNCLNLDNMQQGPGHLNSWPQEGSNQHGVEEEEFLLLPCQDMQFHISRKKEES